jgi:very-short-patch-repair endonuclease
MCPYMRHVDPYLLHQSRINRQQMNHAEVRLWWDLRRNQLGVRFRRQHVVHGALLDFACLPLKLGVESDGSQHRDFVPDRLRDELLRSHGWTILRFWSWDIFYRNEMVLRTIGYEIDRLKGESIPPGGQ